MRRGPSMPSGTSARPARSWPSGQAAWLALAFSLLLLATGRSHASESKPADARELLTELNNVSIDSSQIYFIRDARITRDRTSLYFNRGFLGFFKPVAGEGTGTAFLGGGGGV